MQNIDCLFLFTLNQYKNESHAALLAHFVSYFLLTLLALIVPMQYLLHTCFLVVLISFSGLFFYSFFLVWFCRYIYFFVLFYCLIEQSLQVDIFDSIHCLVYYTSFPFWNVFGVLSIRFISCFYSYKWRVDVYCYCKDGADVSQCH